MLPTAVRTRVEDIFLDALASAFAGRTQELVRRADGPARAFAGDGSATVIGDAPGSPATATFLNAYAITSATICDVYRPGLCHVTPVALPPLLALAESRDSTWSELVTALAVGIEVTVRLASGLDYELHAQPGLALPGGRRPGRRRRRRAARLLGLDGAGVTSALAHGAAQAAGTFAALGTEAVKFNQARGAVSGLLAALMGESGLRAAPRWLTHTDGGMAHTYSHGRGSERVVADLGSRWELLEISLRRWPAASSVQSLIEACLELRREGALSLGDDFARPGRARPGCVRGERSARLGRFARSSAVGPLGRRPRARGRRLVARVELSRPPRRSEACRALRRSGSTVISTPELGQAGVRVRVERTDGGILSASRDDAPGDPARPLGRGQIEEKLRRAAEACGLSAAGEALIEFVRAADGERPVAGMIAGLAGR